MNIPGLTIIPKVMFTHDCDGCIHLGCAKLVEFRERTKLTHYYDLYLCKNCDDGSIVIRFANEGPSYSSSMIAMIPQMVIAGECKQVSFSTQLYVVAMHLALLKMIEDEK